MPSQNWIEQFAGEWFRFQSYLVENNVKFGHGKDIDVLAFNGKEYCVVDCQSYIGERATEDEEAKILKQRFDDYMNYLPNSPYGYVTHATPRKIFVLGDITAEKLQSFTEKLRQFDPSIEIKSIEQMIDEVKGLFNPKDKYPNLTKYPSLCSHLYTLK